jgi:hypothetical protein
MKVMPDDILLYLEMLKKFLSLLKFCRVLNYLINVRYKGYRVPLYLTSIGELGALQKFQHT